MNSGMASSSDSKRTMLSSASELRGGEDTLLLLIVCSENLFRMVQRNRKTHTASWSPRRTLSVSHVVYQSTAKSWLHQSFFCPSAYLPSHKPYLVRSEAPQPQATREHACLIREMLQEVVEEKDGKTEAGALYRVVHRRRAPEIAIAALLRQESKQDGGRISSVVASSAAIREYFRLTENGDASRETSVFWATPTSSQRS